MPRGQPDYGLYTGTYVASGISDPGEAAARLGSINVFDRRGWTVWMDDFEAAALKWFATSGVGGDKPILSHVLAWMGAQSVFLRIAGALNSTSWLSRYFPLIRRGRMGVEFWTHLWNGEDNYLELNVTIRDGTNVTVTQLRLDSNLRTATIVTPAGDIPVADKCFPTVLTDLFVPVKLVVDMDTDYHTRLLIGPDEYDISTHLMLPFGATTDKYLYIKFQLLNGGGPIGYAYIDNFILTQNEP